MAQAMVDAIDAELATPKGAGESWYDFRVRLKRAEIAAMWAHIETNARVEVTTDVTGTVDAPIPVTVTPATGIGSTTSPGNINSATQGHTADGRIT